MAYEMEPSRREIMVSELRYQYRVRGAAGAYSRPVEVLEIAVQVSKSGCLRIAMVAMAFVAMAPLPGSATDPEQPQPEVKKSSHGICHVRGERGYQQTTHFTPFESLDACLKSGGRLPGGNAASQPGAKTDGMALYDTENTNVVKKSRAGICHDHTSPSYGQVKNYTAYATMQDCLDSGGRLPGH
jgi:hypothetical protein